MKTTARLLSLLILGAAIAGCQTSRPIEKVMEDGLEAYDETDFATAETDFQEYVDRRPGDARGHYQLGRTLLALDRPMPASEHLWVAYDLEPEDLDYLETLAQSLFESERIDDLYRLLTSLTADPATTEDYLRLGRYAARLGDADQAEPALVTAVRIDNGQSPTPLIALAEFYRSVGDEENETRALIKAYKIDDQNEEVASRLRELGQTPGPTLTVAPGGDW
jgi:cytochrome c-type biogenesis protein CcmH/NrfG